MKSHYRKVLESHCDELCKGMDPVAVMDGLRKRGVFKKYDWEEVENVVTTQNKNLMILEKVGEGDFNTLSEFLRVLTSIGKSHHHLAKLIQPVQHCIAWFTPSPAHAAEVVHTLQEYASAKFSKMERSGEGKSLVTRRARIFPKDYTDDPKTPEEEVSLSHGTEVCLVFPASSHSVADVSHAMESWFAGEGLVGGADLVLMSTGGGGDGRGVVIATQVCGEGERMAAGIPEVELRSLETHLAHLLVEGKGVGDWVDKECTGVRPAVEFHVLSQHSEEEENNADSVPLTGESCATLALKFYGLCKENYPNKRSVFCQPNTPTGAGDGLLGVESTTGGAESTATGGVESTATGGVESTATGGAESAATGGAAICVTSCCVLMEICRHYCYTPPTEHVQ